MKFLLCTNTDKNDSSTLVLQRAFWKRSGEVTKNFSCTGDSTAFGYTHTPLPNTFPPRNSLPASYETKRNQVRILSYTHPTPTAPPYGGPARDLCSPAAHPKPPRAVRPCPRPRARSPRLRGPGPAPLLPAPLRRGLQRRQGRSPARAGAGHSAQRHRGGTRGGTRRRRGQPDPPATWP